MRSFLHTVQKNQMLMMTPNSLGRSAAMKSFIKHTTPMRIDPKVSSQFNPKQSYTFELSSTMQGFPKGPGGLRCSGGWGWRMKGFF